MDWNGRFEDLKKKSTKKEKEDKKEEMREREKGKEKDRGEINLSQTPSYMLEESRGKKMRKKRRTF